jgi:hypothetical protein
MPPHRTLEALEAALPHIAAAPKKRGEIALLVRRPGAGRRERVESAVLDPVEGLVGDDWSRRRCRHTEDGSPHPGMQLTLMGVRIIEAIAGEQARWPMAGDQIFVDLDLGADRCGPGARLRVGEAIVEVSAVPHLGCKKFIGWFGPDANRFVNARAHRALNLRGINATIIDGGVVRVGDTVEILG